MQGQEPCTRVFSEQKTQYWFKQEKGSRNEFGIRKQLITIPYTLTPKP